MKVKNEVQRRSSARQLFWFVLAMLVFGGAVVGCGGPSSEPVRVASPGLELRASLEPAAPRVGENRLWIELRAEGERPVEGAAVHVKVHMPAMGSMPPMGGPVQVSELGDGLYRADFELVMGGQWQVKIAAVAPQGREVEAQGTLSVGAPGLRFEDSDPREIGEEAGEMSGHRPSSQPQLPAEQAESAGGHPAEFQITGERLQKIGVSSSPVLLKPMQHTLRAVGRVAYDETALADVSLKVRGWVGELAVDAIGNSVERGQVLFALYSPELYTAQEEYLQALRSRAQAQSTDAPERADYLVRSARKRLELWDIAETELAAVARTGKPLEHIPIRAPVSGFVIEKNLVQGSAVEPGQRLYRIAPLDPIWVEAEIYESELPLVEVGQEARVELPHLPAAASYSGTVTYLYPDLTPATRTARLRIELPNPKHVLRPGMWVNVKFTVDLGERLIVPSSAVLYAGERNFVFIERAEGRFEPREVEVGMQGDEETEILRGLSAGEKVVSSGTFLIASESRLRAALDQW